MPETKPSATPAPAAEPQWDKLYGERYYLTDYTVPYGRNEHWLSFFGHSPIASSATSVRGRRSMPARDGHPRGAARSAGVDAWGVDISEYAISNAADEVRDKVWVGSLTEPLPRRYELVTCIEVLEHLPKADGRVALANLCAATDRILFSSVPDGYEEPTHVNVQPAEDWSAWFAEEGFVRDLDYDASYLAPWAIVYERRRPDLADVVRDYDRVYARLRSEVQQLRSVLLEMQLNDPGNYQARNDELRNQVLELQESLLSARDSAMGAEATLGNVRGEAERLSRSWHGNDSVQLQLDEILDSRSWRS